MRRISAHFALAAIFIALLSPFAPVAQMSVHACCLRAGAHHCQEASREAGVHSAANSCPYAAPFFVITYAGIEAAKFRISSPALTGFVTHPNYRSHSSVLVRDAAARAPPLALL